jgi:hypothetical protein
MLGSLDDRQYLEPIDYEAEMADLECSEVKE